MSAPSSAPTDRAGSSAAPAESSHTRRLVAVIVLVPVLVGLALWAFAWPASRTAPRDLPVAVAGPAAAAQPFQQKLEQREGAFEVHRYADEAAARDAVEDRSVYGAVVATPQGPKLLTASAGGPLVAQLLQQAMTEHAPEGTRVLTEDVVPTSPDDPRGAVLGASVLPLGLAGVAAGGVVTLIGLRGRRAALALIGSAVLVGVVGAALTHSWLGALNGNWWAEAGTLALSTLAVSAAVAGIAALVGTAGIGIGALVVVLLGNPFSGMSSAPELLPEPVGAIGQWLPPGAMGSLVRSVSFFDAAAAARPALVLSAWAVLGLAAVLLGARRGQARTR